MRLSHDWAFNECQAPVVPVAPGSKLLGSRDSAGQQTKPIAIGRTYEGSWGTMSPEALLPSNANKSNYENKTSSMLRNMAFNSFQAPVVPVAPGSKLLGSRDRPGQQAKPVAIGRTYEGS